MQSKLKTARTQMNGAGNALAGRLNDAAGYADEFVHDKPWHTLGAVARLALLVGFLGGVLKPFGRIAARTFARQNVTCKAGSSWENAD